MWSFLLGSAVTAWALNNRPKVQHGLATLFVRSGQLAEDARRKSAELSEELEDIWAEARAQQQSHDGEKRGRAGNRLVN